MYIEITSDTHCHSIEELVCLESAELSRVYVRALVIRSQHSIEKDNRKSEVCLHAGR